MAVIWKKRVQSRLYEVRTAGRTRRLYTNGVLHTQYSPAHPLTGSVWDLLFVPAFFYPRPQIQRVLLLGVGGGALIKQYNHFIRPVEIIGVDINAVHLYVARRFFSADQSNVTLMEQDARAFLRDYRGPGFDVIIDDLFADDDGVPERAIPVNTDWAKQILRHLNLGGMVITNFGCAEELKYSAYMRGLRGRFQSCFS